MKPMRTLAAFSLVLFVASAAQAQVLGYAVAGPATTMGFVNHSRITFNAAGGAEVRTGHHVGIGGEAGLFNRLLVGSANLTLHFQDQAHRRNGVHPFVTAGYSQLGIGDGEGAFSAFNLGAGLHFWPSDHAGVRIDIRDHLRPDDRGATHYWSARIGIAFR